MRVALALQHPLLCRMDVLGNDGFVAQHEDLYGAPRHIQYTMIMGCECNRETAPIIGLAAAQIAGRGLIHLIAHAAVSG